MKNYLSYWTPENAHGDFDRGLLFDSAWNSRYNKVKPGDTLWMVTSEDKSLILLGKGDVQESIPQSEAKKNHPILGGREFWPQENKWPIYWVLIKDPKPLTWVPITDIAPQLTFESKTNSRMYEDPSKWGNALQTLRTLTPESVLLLQARLGLDSAGGSLELEIQEPETPEELEARKEGKETLRSHLHRERLSYFRDQKLREAIKPYRCEACEMTFEGRYGSIGKNFIEVHHKNPIADGERETKLEDLALLCSNCHRMIHKTENLSDIESFKNNHLKSFKTQSA